MATFMWLTRAFNPKAQVVVNLDLVQTISREPAVDNDYQGKAPARTILVFSESGEAEDSISVAETPEEIYRRWADKA